MRSVDPAFKLVGMLILTIVLAAVGDPCRNVVIFATCFALLLTSGVGLQTIVVRLAPVLLVAAGLFMTGYRFAGDAGAPVKLGDTLVANSGAMNGLILSTRVLAYAGLGFLFALTTDKVELVRSLHHYLRLPATYAYALMAAWNILPDMAYEYRKTRYAFRARGLNPLPFAPSLLKPILVKTVLWSQALAVAMESKGFDGRAQRTEWHVPRIAARDIAFLLIIVIAASWLLVWR